MAGMCVQQGADMGALNLGQRLRALRHRQRHRGPMQAGGADQAVAAGQHRTLQQVAQFAHIPGKS